MSFPVTLNGRTYTLADFEGTNYVDGFPDALEDFVTQAGDIYNTTSTSSVAIGTGSKSFTTADSGKPYQAGTPLRIADAADPETNFMDCIVTSYSGTSLVVDAFGFAGSGTKSSWTINIGGAKTVDGTLAVNQGGTGATTASAARTNLGLGSIATQDADSVNIDGGNIDGVTIGGASAGAITATTLSNTGNATLQNLSSTNSPLNISSSASDGSATLDASGNLLVGQSSASFTNNGIALRKDSSSIFVNDGTALTACNTTDSGSAINIRNSSSIIGSIGVIGADLYIAEDSNVGLVFNTGGNDNVKPCDASGSDRDNAIDLGSSGARFKDLYLSGGVYLGGTGSANKLTDYEEGTFTPAADFQNTSPSSGATTGSGRYTKIGRMCHVEINLANINVTGAIGDLQITGLPFNSDLDGSIAAYHNGNVYFNNVNAPTGAYSALPQILDGEDVIEIRILIDNTTGHTVDHNDCSDGSTDIRIGMTYEVAN